MIRYQALAGWRSDWVWAAALCIFSLANVSGSGLLGQAAAALPQGSTGMPAKAPEYLVPQRLAPEQMSPADAALIRSKQKEIAREAEFFGYDLGAGHWSYDQLLCPEMPDELVLHYRSKLRRGAESLFTALVPRGAGRVLLVPVLYGGATPFHSAIGAERTIAAFNRAVPGELAAKAVDPDGPWLALAVCYAEVAGAEPRVPQRPDLEPGLIQAPVPTLHLSEEDPNRSEIIFTDRDAPNGYLVWTIAVNKQGRVISAATRSLADYVARPRTGKEPAWKPAPEGSVPKERPLPPGTQPPTVQRPQ